MATGSVKWFNSTKGFGFIAPDGGSKAVFLHISALERAGLRALKDGQKLTFDIGPGRARRPHGGRRELPPSGDRRRDRPLWLRRGLRFPAGA